MRKMKPLVVAYIACAALLYFQPKFIAFLEIDYHLGWKILFNAMILAIAWLAHRRFQKSNGKIEALPIDMRFSGWHKPVIIAALFLGMTLIGGYLGNLIGGYALDGMPKEMIAKEYTYFLGQETTQDEAIVIAVVEKALRLAIGATTEEVFFRWMMLGAMLTFMSPVSSLLLSSFLFGFIHVFSPWAHGHDILTILRIAIPAVTSGIFMGLVYWKYGLGWSALIHFAGNLFPDFRGEPWLNYLAYAVLTITAIGIPAMAIESIIRRTRSFTKSS